MEHAADRRLRGRKVIGLPARARHDERRATPWPVRSREYHLKGAILSTYVPDEPGDGISVGDENAELESNGSYVYANRYTDRNGAQVVMLIRASYCPGVICNIISEPVLVYQEKCSITFGGDGRVITMADGKRLCLSMTSNDRTCARRARDRARASAGQSSTACAASVGSRWGTEPAHSRRRA